MDIDVKVENYLKERFGSKTSLISMERLGEGVHGTAYRVTFTHPKGEDRLIMKTLFHSRFGHDHYSDRAQVLLLAQANFNEMPKHVRATDVVGESPERLISVKDAREFYIFMEEAEGVSYFEDLDAILKRGRLNDLDRERAGMLARFIADVHALRYTGEDAKTLYRRRIRDLIGHGECIMGIIDAYDPVDFTTDRELVAYAGKSLNWWGKIRDRGERLCSVHGDYHPGNIRLQGDDFVLLDRSRGTWGEPADDVSCLGMNYIHYAVKDRGTFEGPFADLFRIFLDAYLEKTGDAGFFEVAQPFFAFRVLVIANPKFYPDDTVETKRKLIDFGLSVLETARFDPEKIAAYLEGK
ncbi:MAG: aminoglycoside phosphotransferase family protein [Deltaproteobacteria bacterium]|nr:aminoglycoside phosphotransferase family protein [Deltaproteobacteria bacterium]